MLTFPTLKTGAVTQYPATKSIAFHNAVLRFLDGSEQRFRIAPSALHRWVIRLDLLDEAELAAIDAFFAAADGTSSTFSFPDPATGTSYPNCFLESGDLTGTYKDTELTSTQIVIREGRGS